MSRSLLCAAAIAAALPAFAAAHEPDSVFAAPLPAGTAPLAPEQFGPGALTTIIPIDKFKATSSGQVFTFIAGYATNMVTDEPASLSATLDVPPGADVASVCMELRDHDPAAEASFVLVGTQAGSGASGPQEVVLAGAATGIASIPGYFPLCASPVGNFTFPLQVRSFGRVTGSGAPLTLQYSLRVLLPHWTPLEQIKSGPAVIIWRRVVSPAPLTATFTDVPTTHSFFPFIEALVRAGITGGCATGQYCPGAAVTRGQMAVFLATALGLYFPN